ncbi:MAG: type II secretion system F family protein [Alphaproteobacteria bacterium]
MLSSKRAQTKKRIQRIRQRKVSDAKKVGDVSLRRKTEDQKGLIYWLMKPLPDSKRLQLFLERAGKNIPAKRYLFKRFISFVLIACVAWFFRVPWHFSLVIGFVVGVWLPFALLKRKIIKRKKEFLKLFPDAIDLIVRGLRSGLPVSESLVMVSKEVPDPVGSTFGNISNTMKLGVTMEKALMETARKLNMTEFNFFTTSIVLQRETGGNLSEILSNLSEVLRGRFIMHMKIRAMSSEARASAYIIGALPFLVIGAVAVFSPGYMNPLIDDPVGNMWAGIAATMLFGGMWIMNRMTKFEI